MDNIRYAVAAADGTYVRPVSVSLSDVDVSQDGEMPFYTPDVARRAFKPQSFTLSAKTMSFDRDALRDVLGIERTVALAFEQQHTITRYRHKYIWQYRGERKGTKKKRNRKPWRTARRRTILPNVVITSDE